MLWEVRVEGRGVHEGTHAATDRLLEGFIDYVPAEWPPLRESRLLDAVTIAPTGRTAISSTFVRPRTGLTESKIGFDVPLASRTRGGSWRLVREPLLTDGKESRPWIERDTARLVLDHYCSDLRDAWNLLAVAGRTDERLSGKA